MEQQRSGAEVPNASKADASSLQVQTLLAFTAIYAAHGPCSRKFALCVGGDLSACAAALAFTALGGACLLIDAEPRRLQIVGRVGATDFTVTGLSEALRILKNELRKGTPVGVGLCGDANTSIAELLRRGVQPDLVCGVPEELTGFQPFIALGAARLLLPPSQPAEFAGARPALDRAATMNDRRSQDRLLTTLSMDRPEKEAPLFREVQSRWLAVAPRLFRADKDRVSWQMEGKK